MRRGTQGSRYLIAAAATLLLAACQGIETKPPPHAGDPYDPRDREIRDRYGTLFGEDTFVFRTGRVVGGEEGKATTGIGVNAYLWRATLETLDFIPLASADPFGGLIITDWYQPVEAPNERFKLTVLIRDTVLRADAIKVSVFRQVKQPDGSWIDAPVEPTVARELEDKILTRAREIRIATIRAGG